MFGSSNNSAKKVRLNKEMYCLLEQAFEKDVVATISSPKGDLKDLFIIEACPDALANADKLALDYYAERGMRDEATELHGTISNKHAVMQKKVTKFLSQEFNLKGKDDLILVSNGNDPRFGDGFFYAPQYFRVGVKAKFKDLILKKMPEFAEKVGYSNRSEVAP